MSDEVPSYLMPVAAVLGMYSVFAGLRVLYFVYKNLRKSSEVPSLFSRTFLLLAVSAVASTLLYGRVVASVDNALATSSWAHFDPYDLLQIPAGTSNVTEIKQAYRSLSKIYHPDKQQPGDGAAWAAERFHQVHLAYQALTDETGMQNYQRYGHPDGPPSTSAMAFALPGWLLHPQGNVAIVLVLLYMGMFGYLIYFVLQWNKEAQKKEEQAMEQKNVMGGEALYLARQLTPDSTHIDILMAIATTPEMIRLSQEAFDKSEEIRAKRLEEQERIRQLELKSKAKESANVNFLEDLDEGGWATDDAEDEESKKASLMAKKEEERIEKEREELDEALGKIKIKVEGVDEGVLGQKWVEKTLEENGQWPPKDLGIIKDREFMYKGKAVSALEHPAVRRNLCMLTGRMNSVILNGHTELLEAGAKALLDESYFKGTAAFRQRVQALLDHSLRVSAAFKSYRLAKTIVETKAMFKVGTSSPTDREKIEWFQGAMKKEYDGEDGIPKLNVSDVTIETADEDQIATGDTVTFQMILERPHAQNFTTQRVAQCKKQGIPPQLVMQSFTEGWWIFVRAKKLDGTESAPAVFFKTDGPLMQQLEEDVLDKFRSEAEENWMWTALPVVIKGIARKRSEVAGKFMAPDVPGKYRIFINIKSQEYLGADQEITQDIEVVDSSILSREEQDDEGEEDEGQADEDDNQATDLGILSNLADKEAKKDK